eukprot:1146208-Pelagomonas_calceolata.AAC.4
MPSPLSFRAPLQKSDNDCLGVQDLQRIQDLGKGVVFSSPNAKLVGGRWKYIPRPATGDVVYTDYYGELLQASSLPLLLPRSA